MARIEGEIVIGRSIEDVFDFVVDERNEPRYNPRMLRAEKISPGPIGAGSQFRAEFSSFRRPSAISEITAYERPQRLASRTHMSALAVLGNADLRLCSGRHPDALVLGLGTTRHLQAHHPNGHPHRSPPRAGDLGRPQAPARIGSGRIAFRWRLTEATRT